MKTEIEKTGVIDLETAEAIARLVIDKGLQYTKLFCSIYHPALLIGKGGSHIWIKESNDIKTRVAITYL